jgi:hypothetical protein
MEKSRDAMMGGIGDTKSSPNLETIKIVDARPQKVTLIG